MLYQAILSGGRRAVSYCIFFSSGSRAQKSEDTGELCPTVYSFFFA